MAVPQDSHKFSPPLRAKCPNMEFFLVHIFLYSGLIQRFTKYIYKNIFQEYVTIVSNCSQTKTVYTYQ